MHTHGSVLAKTRRDAHEILTVVLLGGSVCLSGCTKSLPVDTPEVVRQFVALSKDEQVEALDQHPPALRVELVCAAWRYARRENTDLVAALAGSGCAVLPGIVEQLERDQGSDVVARRLLDTLAEMDLQACDSTVVDEAIRAAAERIPHLTDSYDRIAATKQLDGIQDTLSR